VGCGINVSCIALSLAPHLSSVAFCFHHHTMATCGRKPKTPLAPKPHRKAPVAKHGAQAGKTGYEDYKGSNLIRFGVWGRLRVTFFTFKL